MRTPFIEETTSLLDAPPGTATAGPAPAFLRCENCLNPLGIDEPQPRITWRLTDDRRGGAQEAYQVMVASSPQLLDDDQPDLWDSGRVASDRSVDVAYAGQRLVSRQRCWWKVRVWDQAAATSAWSEPAMWEMGLLEPTDWSAHWIASPFHRSDRSAPCPYLRRVLQVNRNVVAARIYVTARGLFTLELNGQRIGRDELAPGWSDYTRRLMYLTYDVTDLVRRGDNVIGAILADGWYCGHLLWDGRRNNYGNRTGLLLQMELELADGTRQTVRSDDAWRAASGPILESDIYNGERYDARLEMPSWSTPHFDDSNWVPVTPDEPTKAQLVAKRNDSIRAVQELSAIAVTEPEPGVHIVDLGQNMVGWARLKTQGPAGTEVTLRFGEMLNDDGTLYTANLRTAKATDTFILRGDGIEQYEPHFTFHGFRYVEVTGCVVKPDAETITGIVLHSDMPPTGSFECSSPKINRLQQNILWGQKGNFLDVPTDCPQRDERLGWTGDAQVFIRTAAFNMDVSAFFEKWGFDVVDAQTADGAFTHIAPDLLPGHFGSAGWGDAGVLCPWTIYLCYGQTRILEQNFDAMVRWIEFQRKTSRDLVRPAEGYGDWLAIDAVEPGHAPTPRDLIGTAYFSHSTRITARIARLLGKTADATRLDALADDVQAVFNRQFVTPAGRVVGHTQTGYLIALAFDLLPESMRPTAVEHLVDLIKTRDWHLSTGFLGTPLLLPVLSRFGRTDVAFRLIHQESYPSWLYPIEQGATTMWERWNSYTKTTGFGDVAMNSFNHYAFGAVGEWLYATVGGIDLDPDCPGYRHAIVRPDPGTVESGLRWANTTLMTPYGPLGTRWHVQGDQMTVKVTIPPNTTATIHLPAAEVATVRESGRPLDMAPGIHSVRVAPSGRSILVEAKAGTYAFVSDGLSWLTGDTKTA